MGSYGKISSLFLKLCGVSDGYTADCLQKDQLFVYVFAALLKQVTSMTSSGISKEGLQALAKSVEAVEAAVPGGVGGADLFVFRSSEAVRSLVKPRGSAKKK